jgi:hypothetical protein
MSEPMTEYFTIAHRANRYGKDHPLVLSVAQLDMQKLYQRTNSPRLRLAINSFLARHQAVEGAIVST